MRAEEGFSAVELLVTVLLVSVVSFMLLDFLDSSTDLSGRATLHARAQQDAELALRTFTQDLRAANPITGSASCAGGYKDCVSFDIQRASQTGRDCEKTVITYKLVAGSLTRILTENTWNTGTSACKVTRSIPGYTVASSLVNATVTPAEPLLTYYDNKGVVLNPATQATTIAKKPALGGAASIRVTLLVKYKSNAPELRLSSVVALRNSR